jgi:hypothetical protein
VGDACEDCGEVLVLCLLCGVDSRCLTCTPYERRPARDEEHRVIRMARASPELGLIVGAFAALVPAALVWVTLAFVAPGLARTAGIVAGAVAACAFLAAGAALGKLPLPGEVPACRADDWTPYDHWLWTGAGALVLQCALLSVGIPV